MNTDEHELTGFSDSLCRSVFVCGEIYVVHFPVNEMILESSFNTKGKRFKGSRQIKP
jgi:hypothetical protein